MTTAIIGAGGLGSVIARQLASTSRDGLLDGLPARTEGGGTLGNRDGPAAHRAGPTKRRYQRA
jgi:hypothetical protein